MTSLRLMGRSAAPVVGMTANEASHHASSLKGLNPRGRPFTAADPHHAWNPMVKSQRPSTAQSSGAIRDGSGLPSRGHEGMTVLGAPHQGMVRRVGFGQPGNMDPVLALSVQPVSLARKS